MINYKAKEELKQSIIDAINDGRLIDTEVSEIHHEVFNTDYWIIDRAAAANWLTDSFDGGVFEAIGIVKEYEMDNFGELYTDISEAERVANMIAYIYGEKVLYKAFDEMPTNVDFDCKTYPKFLYHLEQALS